MTTYQGAACAGMDTEIFFERPDIAIPVCNDCPVRSRCRADAERRGEQFGVFGGRDFTYRAKPGGRTEEQRARRRVRDRARRQGIRSDITDYTEAHADFERMYRARFADVAIARHLGVSEATIRRWRKRVGWSAWPPAERRLA